MKRSLFIFLLLIGIINQITAVPNFSNAELANEERKRKKDTVKWKIPDAKLIASYALEINEHRTEVLRLYDNDTYEFLKYNRSGKRSLLTKENGTYNLLGPVLKLKRPKRRSISESCKSIYILVKNKGLLNAKSLVLGPINKTAFLLKERKEENYHLPFYIDPLRKTIISNREAADKVDLRELVAELTKNCVSQRDKVNTLIQFVQNSIEYDLKGSRSGKYSCRQGDASTILAGRKRKAVCAGYSYTIQTLCKYAGVDCKWVSGSARNHISDLDNSIGSNHAWNMITIDGKDELYDVTWADSNGDTWLNVSPALMIYTHFPDDSSNQLLVNPMTKAEFDRSPIIVPHYTFKRENTKFTGTMLPKDGLVFTDSIFTLKIAHEVVDRIAITGYPERIFNTSYRGEPGRNSKWITLITINDYITYAEKDTTYIQIPLDNFINGLSIEVNDRTYQYKAVKATKSEYIATILENTDKQKIDSYIQGIAASIHLNDTSVLASLVGDRNELFFYENGQIKDNLIKHLKEWDCKTSSWNKTLNTGYKDGEIFTKVENTIKAGNCKFNFVKFDGEYEIIAVNELTP